MNLRDIKTADWGEISPRAEPKWTFADGGKVHLPNRLLSKNKTNISSPD